MKYLIIILTAFSIFYGCKPEDEKFTTSGDAQLRFSEDTVCFDTILTSIGSITKRFKVYNDDKNAVTISDIRLAGPSSPYSIIVNGVENDDFSNVTLLGKDSLLVLVEVLINPNNNDQPYLIRDSVEFTTNGNFQHVKLLAYAQDAHFLTDSTLACGANWTSGKPYVIVDSVTVPIGCNLTIDKGTRVLFNSNAKLVVNGSLTVNGDKDSIVTFCNENDISTNPEKAFGYWTGIQFSNTSTGNSINHALIKNAAIGLYVSNSNSVDSIAELSVTNSIIKDISISGIRAYNSDVFLENTVITNCTEHLFEGLGGGNYSFIHCSLANYSFDFFRNGEALLFNNSDSENGMAVSNTLELAIHNSVIDGNFNEEIDLNGSSSTYATNSFLKTNQSSLLGGSNQINEDPKFVNESAQILELDTLSPLIDYGNTTYGNAQDLLGNSRDANPDVGAYEKVP